eukprot:g2184.t1
MAQVLMKTLRNGILGIGALLLGAPTAIFVEVDPKTCEVLEEALEEQGLRRRAQIIQQDLAKPYSGRLVNSGYAWSITDIVLKWDGLGMPPPELPLRPRGPPEPIPEEQQSGRRKKFAEQAEQLLTDRRVGSGATRHGRRSRAYGVTHPHSLSERQNGTNAMDESVLVTLARVAERAERYDEMADFMKQRVEVGSALNPEDIDPRAS